MIFFFRKLLIGLAKRLPFIFVGLILIGQIEIIYAMVFDCCVTTTSEGEFVLYTPISNFLGKIVYIDWIDVLLLYILCFALELCWRTFLCVHVIVLNLAFRTLLERINVEDSTLVGILVFLALCAFFCVWNGIKLYLTKKLLKL